MENEEVVVKPKAPTVGKKTVLRWVGEISVDREEEMMKLFDLKPETDAQKHVVHSVATWLSGTDVVLEDAPEVVEAQANEALPVEGSAEDEAFKQELQKQLAAFEGAALQSLSDFVAKYNIIRASSPTLVALGPTAIEVLLSCGFKSDGQYLKVDDRNKLRMAREVLEAMRAEANKTLTIPARYMNAPHGSSMGKGVLDYGFHDSIGRRAEMEDEAAVRDNVYAVFDGHGGANVAKMCAAAVGEVLQSHLKANEDKWSESATKCFQEMHDHVVAFRMLSGATAVVAQVLPNILRLAHAGDSRAVLVLSNGKARRLTEDHKPELPEERARIIASGGRVVKTFLAGVYRVNGELSVARAIGDVHYSEFGVTCVPTCSEVTRTAEMHFLILACDGIWDVLSDAAAAKLVHENANQKKRSLFETATTVVETAFRKGSNDNLSCLIVGLRGFGNETTPNAEEAAASDYL
jgi:serine/threonine protein phosphatase PrpC